MADHVFDLQFDTHARLHTCKHVPPVFTYMHTYPWMDRCRCSHSHACTICACVHTVVWKGENFTSEPQPLSRVSWGRRVHPCPMSFLSLITNLELSSSIILKWQAGPTAPSPVAPCFSLSDLRSVPQSKKHFSPIFNPLQKHKCGHVQGSNLSLLLRSPPPRELTADSPAPPPMPNSLSAGLYM